MIARLFALSLALGIAAVAPFAAQAQAPAAANSGVVASAARPATVIVDRFHAALRSGDTDAALALLTDDALVFESGRIEAGKTVYASHHLAADAEFSKAVSSSRLRRWAQASGSTAWVATESRSTGTFRGRPIDSRTTETMVLRKLGGRWRIAHIHWSSRD